MKTQSPLICWITVLFICVQLNSHAQVIRTIAGNGVGGFNGDSKPATSANIYAPFDIIFDLKGNIIFADCKNNRLRKITPTGIISTIAGTGKAGYTGDKGPATLASINFPTGITIDKSGVIYFADAENEVIRKIDTNGIITTVAGGGKSIPGDNGPATNARILGPNGIDVDQFGNLYIPDQYNRVHKVSPDGIITTIAGKGMAGFSGDGGPATNATFDLINDVTVDKNGNIYISDWNNNRIRKVDNNGIINTVIGNGLAGFSGDGSYATATSVRGGMGVTIDKEGNIIFCDVDNQRIRKVNKKGIISTIAGSGTSNYGGDDQDPLLASLYRPVSIALDSLGNIYISDRNNNRIRKISITDHPEKNTSLPISPYGVAFWWTATLCAIALTLIVTFVTKKIVTRNNVRRNLRQQLELKSVYSQINPHFIFNTLTTALFYVKKNRTDEAYDHITKFSTLLRSYIKSARDKYITIESEIENLNNYIRLQQGRFEDKFDYEIVVDEQIETSRIKIPSLLLQPIVENAIDHGLFHKKGKGLLKIKFVKGENNGIICIVDDDGIGRKQSKLISSQSLVKAESYGDSLIKDLVAIFNKYEKTGITIEYKDKQEPDSGTTVVISIKNPVYEK